MSKDAVVTFLKQHEGQKFTAAQLGYFLDLNMSVYDNVRKIKTDIITGAETEVKYEIYESTPGGRTATRFWVDKDEELTAAFKDINEVIK